MAVPHCIYFLEIRFIQKETGNLCKKNERFPESSQDIDKHILSSIYNRVSSVFK